MGPEAEYTIIQLVGGATVTCPLPYEQVRERLVRADAGHARLVELPVDWTVGGVGIDARESLLGVGAIQSVRGWPAS